MVISIRDITEEKKIQERLMEQEKLAALGQIAAVIAHELNTPLATIDLTATMLKETLPNQYHHDLQTIKQEVKQASHLIKGTLGFSRMEHFTLQPTTIKPILETALTRQQTLHPNTAITYTTTITNAPIKADKEKLQLALENIIKNAIQAQKTPTTPHHIIITTKKEQDNLTVTIHDNGIGMDDHTQENLFKPFYTTRHKTEGTGLGLYLAHYIITAHNGIITTNSTTAGTSIIITLPLHNTTT